MRSKRGNPMEDPCVPLVLASPWQNGQMHLDTKVCEKDTGYVLVQDKPDAEKFFRIYFSSFKVAKRNDDTTQDKCPLVFRAFLLLISCLEGSRVTIRADHDALLCILSLTDGTLKLQRWQQRFLELMFDVKQWAWIKCWASDALSRIRATKRDKIPSVDKIQEMTQITLNEFSKYDGEDDSNQDQTCCTYEDWKRNVWAL